MYAAVPKVGIFACPPLRAIQAMSRFRAVYQYELSDQKAPIAFASTKEPLSCDAFDMGEDRCSAPSSSSWFGPFHGAHERPFGSYPGDTGTFPNRGSLVDATRLTGPALDPRVGATGPAPHQGLRGLLQVLDSGSG